MMAPTHVATGLVMAAPVATVAPKYSGVAVAGGIVGSLVPDLDLLVGPIRWIGLLVIGVGAAYALVRKRLPPYVARFVG